MESRKLVSSIEARFPEIRAENYRRITAGWVAVVIEINGEYMFRFPKYGGWARQKREISLLKWLAPKLPVAVPRYEFVWSGEGPHLAGYRKILGSTFRRGVLKDSNVRELGDSLGSFLTELHHLMPPPGILDKIPKKLPDQGTHAPKLHRQARKFVYPLLSQKQRDTAETFWTEYTEYFSKVSFEPRLIHGDLGGANVIMDPVTGRLDGVIDWEDAKLGDPALDFTGLFDEDRVLGNAALARYALEKTGFEQRIRFHSIRSSFDEAGWGVWAREKKATKIGLKHIDERLA
jgi:aminoglycoside 2''-phosphotransferase